MNHDLFLIERNKNCKGMIDDVFFGGSGTGIHYEKLHK
jgi:hypothetical protein